MKTEDNSSANDRRKSEEEAFNYDTILDHIGQMGKYQLQTCLWLSFPALFSAVGVMCYSFIGAMPQYRYDGNAFLKNHNLI